MTDYSGKLLYSPSIHCLIEVIGYMSSEDHGRYACYIFDETRSYHAIDLRVDYVDHDVSVGRLRVIQPGDILICNNTEHEISSIAEYHFYISRYCCLPYRGFFSNHYRFKNRENIFDNKNRKTCFKCRCKTLLRRDFSDMSIREFCPRCKV